MLVIEDADELARLGFKDEIYDIFRLLQPPKLLTRQAAASSTSSTGSQAQVDTPINIDQIIVISGG